MNRMTTPPRPVAPPPLRSTPPTTGPALPFAHKADGKADFRSAVRHQAHKLGHGGTAASATPAELANPLPEILSAGEVGAPPRSDARHDTADPPSRDSGAGTDDRGEAPPRTSHAVASEVNAAPSHDTLADHTAAALADQLSATQAMGCFAVQLPGACRVDVIYDLTPERTRLYLRTSAGGTQPPGVLDAEGLASRIGARCGRKVEVLCV